ncbi:MAG: glycosyltransferase family 2 protein [Candidatus Dormibacter sp.]
MKGTFELPAVSLVVLNFNGREHLEACLGSVVAVEYPKDRLEVLLCDNGSSDGSVGYVKERFPGVRVVALDRNYGFAEGNNRAAAQATHPWVGFLNNDMRVEPSWLRNLVEPLAEQPRLACLSSRILNWEGSAIDFIGAGINFQGFGFQFDFGHKQSSRDVPRRLLSPCGGAMVIRRELFREIGGFDPDYFGFYEDADLGWRLNLLGHDVWYTPAATTYHRHHGTYKRFPDYKIQVLYQRNALSTMYKCLDDENLAAALPAAILLLNEKALLLADVRRATFEIAARPGAATAGPDVPPRPTMATKARRALREQGFRAVLRKGAAHARVRAGRLANRGRQVLLADAVPMPRAAVSHYVGLSQFAHNLEALAQKRSWLQQRRVRTDAEILPLFHVALEPSYGDPRYIDFHHWLIRTLELDRRFGAGQDSDSP